MPLFQNSVLNKYLKGLNEGEVSRSYKKFTKYFHDLERQENIRNSKEEQFQEGFLRELFVNVFGYALNPDSDYNLTTELKNIKGAKKVDGAILSKDQALAVIELKGTDTKDLEKVRQQAFDYKANQTGCVYVITSNFERLRFYIDDAVDFIEFNLFTLKREEFDLLYLCLHSSNLLKNTPRKVKNESVIEEEGITKKFYVDYSRFKRELYRDLVKNNLKNTVYREELSKDDRERASKNIKLSLFSKSQKLIDRFLFIFFAEDRGLLSPNTTFEVISDWEKLIELDAAVPLYDRFKQFFVYLDQGREGTDRKDEVFAYNGGLFKLDSILDSLIISDDILLKHAKLLSSYDFDSQVDVNILGHIFENSLNEIESVNAEIEGIAFDKQKTKRKKDGVFYTPKYITKYIVDKTIGVLCDIKKTELKIVESEFHSKRQKETKKKLLGVLEQYREWLLKLTILDPACGSGAFLNQALDFLIKEHHYIDQLQTELFGGGFVFPNIENTILEKNIYGVDLNQESVEIAKLSLWLRTAQPRRKLNNLSNNLKCGNSLVNIKAIAGNKAFVWENEFLEVFNDGGFDVVIGNPPYGASFSKTETDYFNKQYKHQSYQLDSYLLFTEKSKTWVKEGGYIGYIMPNTWLSTLFTDEIRKFVFSNYKLLEVSHYSYFVFDDAVVETDTYILKSENPDQNEITINLVDRKSVVSSKVSQDDWAAKDGKPINIYDTKELKSLKKKFDKRDKLGDLCTVVQGTKPFQKGKGKPKQDSQIMADKPFVQDVKVDETFMPLLRGSLMNRYENYWDNDYWISYGDWLAEPRYTAKFDSEEKLVIRQTGDSLVVCYDDKQFICRDNLYVIRDDSGEVELKYILAVLNSKLLTWYYRKVLNPEEGKALAQVKRGHLLDLPIAKCRDSAHLLDLVSQIEERLIELQAKSGGFLKYLSSQIPSIDIGRKLGAWYELEFKEFITEIQRAYKKGFGKKLSKVDEIDWLEAFESKKEQVSFIKAQVEIIDDRIDCYVYELYGLDEQEIAIIEAG